MTIDNLNTYLRVKNLDVSMLLVLLCALVLQTSLKAQQPMETWMDFNNRPDGSGMLFINDNSFTAFTGLAEIPPQDISVLVRKINFENQLISETELQQDNLSWAMIGGKSVAKSVANNGFYLTVSTTDPLDQENWFPKIIFCNNDGDTLWSKNLLFELSGKYSEYAIDQLSDGSLILAGSCDEDVLDNSNPIKLSLIKTDFEGNLIWHNVFNHGIRPNVSCVLAGSSGIYVGGVVYEGNDMAYGISKQFIRKFDLDGNSVWYKKIHVPPVGAEAPAVALIEREDGNIVYAGGRSLGVLPGTGEQNNPYTAPCAGVINATTGNAIFENTYSDHARTQQFYNLKKLSTGGYIGVGTHIDDFDGPSQGWPIGFMVKLDDNLNQIWYRYYVPSVWEGFGRWNNLTDVVENDNGTFTAIGLIYTYTGDGPQGPGEGGFIQDTYLITVDEEGCIIPGCYLGFTEVDELENFSVYPNPANDQINLRWSKIENTDVFVYNSTGQIVLKKAVNQQNQIGLDISTLPVGVYTVRCMIDERMYSELFVKQ